MDDRGGGGFLSAPECMRLSWIDDGLEAARTLWDSGVFGKNVCRQLSCCFEHASLQAFFAAVRTIAACDRVWREVSLVTSLLVPRNLPKPTRQ
jgi:hypothetical protein